MLPRVLEAEVIADEAEARAYDRMDHEPANRAFIADLLRIWDGRGPVLDVGAGPAHIPIALARAVPAAAVVALDASEAMLNLAGQHIRRAGLAERVVPVLARAQSLPFASGTFGAVLCNGTLHHFPEPALVLAEMGRVVAAGGRIFVRDLVRPADEAAVARQVDAHAPGADDVQRRMFADSFRAALALKEMRGLVAGLGWPPATVQMTSNRHWTWSAAAPGALR